MQGALHTIGRAVPVKAAAITAYAPEFDAEQRVCRAALRIIETLIGAALEGGR